MLRSKDKVLPLFVSPGHRCDQATATRLTLACLRGYKLPEPTRLADHWAEEFKKEVRVGGLNSELGNVSASAASA